MILTKQSHLHYGDEEGSPLLPHRAAGRLAEPPRRSGSAWRSSPRRSPRYVSGATLLAHGGGERPAFLHASTAKSVRNRCEEEIRGFFFYVDGRSHSWTGAGRGIGSRSTRSRLRRGREVVVQRHRLSRSTARARVPGRAAGFSDEIVAAGDGRRQHPMTSADWAGRGIPCGAGSRCLRRLDVLVNNAASCATA